MGGPDMALGEAHSNAADFLDRPADEGWVRGHMRAFPSSYFFICVSGHV
jgi:hypothetical protein